MPPRKRAAAKPEQDQAPKAAAKHPRICEEHFPFGWPEGDPEITSIGCEHGHWEI